MKKLIFKSTVLSVVAIIGFLASCKKDSEPNVGTPQVVDFTPAAGGPVGTYMTISGTFFSPTDKATTVTVGGATATILTIDQANITTQVPAGATTGKITVTVGGLTGSSTKDFAVTAGTPAPKITGLDPGAGLGADGKSIKINGYNFSSTAALNKVEFAGTGTTTVGAAVTAASANQLTVTVPSGAVTGKVKVSVLAAPGGAVLASGTSGDDFSVPKPSVTSITPTFSSVGSNIVIVGANFAKALANNVVTFTGPQAGVPLAYTSIPATVVSVNGDANQLVVTVPAGGVTGPITVTVDGQSGASADYIYAVTFTGGVTDANALPITSAAVGATVIITGNNFSPSTSGNSVKFGDVAAKVTAAETTKITVLVPAGVTDADANVAGVQAKIKVQVGGSPEKTSATNFTINP